MAASGYTPISLYYSATASAVPVNTNLANGELALNTADMKLYAKNSSGVVTLLASNASTAAGVDSLSFGSTGLTPSTATTGAITVAGTLAVANGGTGVTTSTGTGSVVLSTSPTLVTPALGTPSSGVVTNLTGTASININGTVGATTATTGAFTTLSASSTVTLSGGTANGVAYLNGSKVLTSGTALQFDGTNLGIAFAPSAWNSSSKVLQLGTTGTSSLEAYGGIVTSVYTNAYRDSTAGHKYLTANPASWYYQYNGTHNWLTAVTGVAGNAITFTTPMSLDGSGQLGLGESPISGYRLAVKSADATSGSYAALMRNSASTNLLAVRSDGYFATGTAANSPYNATTASAANVYVDSGGQLFRSTATAGGGSMIYISTVTCSNSTYANVTWTSTENALYDMMVIVATNVQCDQSNVGMFSQFYVGGTLDANNAYAFVLCYPSPGFVTVSNTSGSASYMSMSQNSAFTGNAANNASWVIYIPAPGNSAQYPNMYFTGSMNRNSSGPLTGNGQTNYSTGTTTGVRFFTGGSYFTTGTFRLYGIKKS